MYVDLRYNRLLLPEQKERAKKHILLTWNKIRHLRERQELSLISQTNSPSHMMDSPNPSSLQEQHTDILESILVQKDCEVTVIEKKNENFVAAMEALGNAPRLPKTQDIVKYWSNYYNQDLSKVCLVVLSLPVTQVSVERLFSGLKYILSDLRMRMSPEIVDSIMVLRSNN